MAFEPHEFTVTRQRRWEDGLNIVEISQGGLDYSNPDALGRKYPEDFSEHVGMLAAVETGIELAKKWQKDSKEKIFIAIGNTGGNTAHFEELTLNKKNCLSLVRKARQFDETLPKCPVCSSIGKLEWYWVENPGDHVCSERCVEKMVEDYYENCDEGDPVG